MRTFSWRWLAFHVDQTQSPPTYRLLTFANCGLGVGLSLILTDDHVTIAVLLRHIDCNPDTAPVMLTLAGLFAITFLCVAGTEIISLLLK